MKRRTLLRLVGALLLLRGASVLLGQVPELINYQDRVAIAGVNFTGTGHFRFAFVDGTGAATYWSNDATSVGGSQPAADIALAVKGGLYSVLLGDVSVANMTAIPPAVFAHPDVRLRVWFDDGAHGSQLLAPDQRIAAVGYAIVAGTVADGAITREKIAAGAVGGAQLGLGKITGFVTCNGADPAHTYVYIRGAGSLVYVGDPTPDGYPFQLSLLEPGTYTVVMHSSTGGEVATSVTVAAGETVSGVMLSGTDVASDVNNCGSCGHVCSTENGTPGCVAGNCTVSGCATGYGNCDGNAANGCETNTLADAANCGACGQACAALEHANLSVCSDGVCQISSCQAGYANCDGNPANGCEVNKATDPANCGACGVACSAGPNAVAVCIAGTCGSGGCQPGFADCDNNPANGCEANLASTSSCGACGIVCTVAHGTPACTGGACAIAACDPGYVDCDHNAANGCEAMLQNDPQNCGACAHQCASGQSCSAGVCH